VPFEQAHLFATGQGHVDYTERQEYTQFLWYFIFFGFWVFAFIEACTELTLAVCVTTWFKTKEAPPSFMYFRAIHRVCWSVLRTFGLAVLSFPPFYARDPPFDACDSRRSMHVTPAVRCM
jgi:hypothetical protein